MRDRASRSADVCGIDAVRLYQICGCKSAMSVMRCHLCRVGRDLVRPFRCIGRCGIDRCHETIPDIGNVLEGTPCAATFELALVISRKCYCHLCSRRSMLLTTSWRGYQMGIATDLTNHLCQECGGPVSVVSIDDEFLFIGKFTCCPACGLGNPAVRSQIPSVRSLKAMIPRSEASSWQLLLRRRLRREP